MAPLLPSSTAEDCFEVLQAEGKGLGLFASRDIEAGEHVLIERFFLSCPSDCSEKETVEAIVKGFDALSKEDQTKFLELYAWYNPVDTGKFQRYFRKRRPGGKTLSKEEVDKYTRVVLTFNSNAFGIQENKDGVFLNASRLNHCCDPNVFWSTGLTPDHFVGIATRKIPEGTELFISYIVPEDPRSKRRDTLKTRWGFRCECERCMDTDLFGYDQALKTAVGLEREATAREVAQFPEERSKFVKDEKDEGFGETLERRCESLEHLNWLPELFFAHDAACMYYCYRLTEIIPGTDKELRDPAYDQCIKHAKEALTIAESLWGPYNLLTASARETLESINKGKQVEDGTFQPTTPRTPGK